MSRVKVRCSRSSSGVDGRAGVAVAPLAACQASSASRDAAPRGGASAEAREVQVVAATEDGLVRAIAVTGTLAAEEQVTLSMKVTGRLNDLYVDLGSRVTRGQVLARLVPTDFNLRESQAEAALQQARARLGLPRAGRRRHDRPGEDRRWSGRRRRCCSKAQLDARPHRRRSSNAASRPRPRSTRPTRRWRSPKAATRTRSRRCATGRPSSNSAAPNSSWRARPSATPRSPRRSTAWCASATSPRASTWPPARRS